MLKYEQGNPRNRHNEERQRELRSKVRDKARSPGRTGRRAVSNTKDLTDRTLAV